LNEWKSSFNISIISGPEKYQLPQKEPSHQPLSIKDKTLLPLEPNPVEIDTPLSKKIILQNELNRLKISML